MTIVYGNIISDKIWQVVITIALFIGTMMILWFISKKENKIAKGDKKG